MCCRIALVFVVLALWARPALAETIGGRVIDGQTLSPVADAQVQTSQGQTTTTDTQGYFRLIDVPVGLAVLKVLAPGYQKAREKLRVPAGGLLEHTVVLFSKEGLGEIIEIKARKRPPKRQAPGKHELSREEITRIPGSRGDALQSVKSLPGIANASARGSGPGQIVIRGSAPEDSKITIDGILVPALYHFFGFQSVLPSAFIDSIEYVPGGFGAEEGNATGGVINVKTRGEQSDHTKGFAELSFVNLAGLVTGPISKSHKLYFAVAARRSLIDLVLPLALPDDANLSFTAAPIYYDAQLRVDWYPKYTDRVSLFTFASSDKLSLINDNINPNEPQATGSFDNSIRFIRPILSWHHETDALESRIAASLGVGDFHVGVGPDRFFNLASLTGQLRSDITWQPHKTVELRAGLEHLHRQADVHSKLPLPPGEGSGGVFNFSSAPVIEVDEAMTNHVTGGYMSFDINPNPNLKISPGVRLDYYRRFGAAAWGPRLAIQQRLSDTLLARAAMGSYSRSAERAEAFTTTLRPELATQYVLGGEYKIATAIDLQSSVFYTDRRELIGQDPALARTDPRESYVNIGYGRSFGIETTLRAQTSRFFGWLTYTLSRSDRVDTPLGDRRLFDYDQTHNIVALGSYKIGNWQLGGRFQWSTGQPLTPVEGTRFLSDLNIHLPVLGKINSGRYETPHQLDLRVDRKWDMGSWKLEVYLDITNVYAHPRVIAYRYNFDYSEREAVTELPFVPALGARGSF